MNESLEKAKELGLLALYRFYMYEKGASQSGALIQRKGNKKPRRGFLAEANFAGY